MFFIYIYPPVATDSVHDMDASANAESSYGKGAKHSSHATQAKGKLYDRALIGDRSAGLIRLHRSP